MNKRKPVFISDAKDENKGIYVRSNRKRRRVLQMQQDFEDGDDSALDAVVAHYHPEIWHELGRTRKWLAKFVIPYVNGPLSPEEQTAVQARHQTTGGSIEVLFLSDEGPKVYELLDSIDDLARVAKVALNVLRDVECLFDKQGNHNEKYSSYAWRINRAIYLGSLIERLKVLPLDGIVRSAKKAKRAGGKATKKLTSKQKHIALDLIKKEIHLGLNKTNACKRISARMLRLHGMKIGQRTLLNLYNAQQSGKEIA